MTEITHEEAEIIAAWLFPRAGFPQRELVAMAKLCGDVYAEIEPSRSNKKRKKACRKFIRELLASECHAKIIEMTEDNLVECYKWQDGRLRQKATVRKRMKRFLKKEMAKITDNEESHRDKEKMRRGIMFLYTGMVAFAAAVKNRLDGKTLADIVADINGAP